VTDPNAIEAILRDLAPTDLEAIGSEVSRAELTLRAFAESPAFCGLEYSPLVAAIADASEGIRPDTIDDDTAERHFGCTLDGLPTLRRRTVVVRAGGRGGKTSRLLAVAALHAAWTVPLPTLARGEHAVALIVSSELVFARQALSFCAGYVEGSPTLTAALVGEAGTDALTLRRPDGKLVDVRVRAAGKGGKGGRSFTLVFAGLDEACFFHDESTGVVNDKEIFRAVTQRVVPGGQTWLVSTPWVKDVGELERILGRNFGNHQRALCAVAPTRALNPTWDPDGEIEADMREDDPENADREILAIPLTSGTSHWFLPEALRPAVDADLPLERPRDPEAFYFAGGDFAYKRNAATLTIVGLKDGRVFLAFRVELKPAPGVPLKPSAVCEEFAGYLHRYGCGDVMADSHERSQAAEEFGKFGITVVPAPEGNAGKYTAHVEARRLFNEGRIDLPEDARLLRQLKDVRSRPMPGGGTQIFSPKKADGSHGDVASSFVLAAYRTSLGSPEEDEVLGGRSTRQ
jgi:hypothetical protein